MCSDIAIKVESLSKCYEIYEKPRDRLLQMLARGRKRYFREFWALKDVTFEIKQGETVGIIGRNGSGKSTLLQIICGTLNPSGGQVQTVGRVAALLELGSGFNPEFTGRENVYLNGAVLGLSEPEIDSRFDDIVAFAAIGGFIDQPVKTYSSGMLMRLAFAVIAHVDADILVVDEALSVGDAVFVQKCNRFLKQFIEQGTLLFVSHSMQSVLELCDRAIWLKDGEPQHDGEAKKVVRYYSAHVHQQLNEDAKINVSSKAETSSKQVVAKQKSRSNDTQASVFSGKIFAFDFASAFWGAGGASINNIEVLDEAGHRLDQITDCGFIVVRVQCVSHQNLVHPIVGFNIRNQRGVDLISENTSSSYIRTLPPAVEKGEKFHADFGFFLPYLPVGEYFFGGAIAERRPEGAHVQHHRRDDALRFSVTSSHIVYGVFSMPLDVCRIEIDRAD